MIFQAIILGIIQGFTEFLPISSSAHLYLVPYFFHWTYEGIGFDVALHWGTLLAILLIFWRDYWNALFGDRRMLRFLVIGTVPAALAGYFFEKQAETIFRTPILSAITLAGFALVLWWADRVSSRRDTQVSADDQAEFALPLNSKKSLFMGIAQALAIVPGVSRSGITITAGLFAGLSRGEAARFSFLLSGPIIFGAGLVALPEAKFDPALLWGFLASAISGFLAIKFLLKYLSRNNFNVFVWYRLVLALLILATVLL